MTLDHPAARPVLFNPDVARDELPAVRRRAFLNAGTFGPLPRVADRAMREHMDLSLERGRIGIDEWFRMMDDVRAALALTLGDHEDTIAVNHCTTDGVNTVVSGLSFSAGDEVVTTTHEHPGITAPLDELAHARGVVVRFAAPELGAIAAEIGPRTKLVALSHVLWTNGDVLPLARIAAAAHAAGALVLADGAQAMGAIPVEPAALGVDFYAGSLQKWLCGPSGVGALWVRPSVLGRLRTAWPHFLSRSRTGGVVKEWSGARRLDATTLSMTALAGAKASLRWHREQVLGGALAWSSSLAGVFRERLARTPGVRLAQAARSSTMFAFGTSNEPAAAVAQRLEKTGVLVRSIPGVDWVRVSVGFWNTERDLDALETAWRRALA